MLTFAAPSVAFYHLLTRAWELAAGGVVALTASQWRRLPGLAAAIIGWAGLGVILVGCTKIGATTPYPGTAALFPVLGTALVIGAGTSAPAQGVGRPLSVPPMRAIGRISYSWYLWHWPVLMLAPPLLGHPLGLAGKLVAVLVSVVLAILTLRFIENPLRFATPVRSSAIRSLALGAAATAVAVSVGVALLIVVPVPVGHGPAAPTPIVTAAPAPLGADIDLYDRAVRQAFSQVQAAVAASADLQQVPSNLQPPIGAADAEKPAMYRAGCMRSFLEVEQPECASGDIASTTTVALVGDSNAAMWSAAFQEVAAQRHWRLESLEKAGCPLLDQRVTLPPLRREYTECEQWRRPLIARLQAERPRLIVLSISRTYGYQDGFRSYDPVWFDSLNRLVQQLRGTGAEVLVLGPIPHPASLVPICLSSHLDDATACALPRSKAVNESGIAAESATTRAAGGQYADLTELFCTADRCPAIVGNTLVYLDSVHVTFEYARVLAPVIGALADRALADG